jgi:hypothetical protein
MGFIAFSHALNVIRPSKGRLLSLVVRHDQDDMRLLCGVGISSRHHQTGDCEAA